MPSIFKKGKNAPAKDIEYIARSMRLNTAATIGRNGFEWDDLKDMARVSRRMLERSGFNVIFILKHDGMMDLENENGLEAAGQGSEQRRRQPCIFTTRCRVPKQAALPSQLSISLGA